MGSYGEHDDVNIRAAVDMSPLQEARKRIDDLRAQAKDRVSVARKKADAVHKEREWAEIELHALSAAAEALGQNDATPMSEGGF